MTHDKKHHHEKKHHEHDPDDPKRIKEMLAAQKPEVRTALHEQLVKHGLLK